MLILPKETFNVFEKEKEYLFRELPDNMASTVAFGIFGNL